MAWQDFWGNFYEKDCGIVIGDSNRVRKKNFSVNPFLSVYERYKQKYYPHGPFFIFLVLMETFDKNLSSSGHILIC